MCPAGNPNSRPSFAAWRESLAVSLFAAVFAGTALAEPLEEGREAFDRGEYATAFQLLRPLANQGVVDAQYTLGLMYAVGQGVPQDHAEAARWFRKAGDAGLADAQTKLGLIYLSGLGVSRDYSEAAAWFRKAADAGRAGAQNNLGLMYANGLGVPQDYVEAYKWFNLAALRFAASDGASRSKAMKNSDAAASKMTPAQIAEAQKLVREWKPR